MIFVARQLQEKCREQNRNLCMAFIDLAKAFDTVNRDLLWRVMRKFGCPQKFTNVVRAFHSGMMATVIVGGKETEPFGVEVGVKQGCVIAPVIFNVYLAAATSLFRQRFRSGGGIGLTYRMDGGLFNLRRLQARTKVSTEEICELQYADDCVLVAHSPMAIQEALSCLFDVYSALGLVINCNKTEIVYQWTGASPPVVPRISISDRNLKVTPYFCYLGSLLSSDCTADDEINKRINKALASFARIRKKVILNHNLRIATKVAVYRAVCLSVLFYGCETFTIYRRHIKLLENFNMQCIKKILGITWRDRVPYTEMLTRTGLQSIECQLLRRQLRWVGHVLRMPDERYPKQVLFSQLTDGRRNNGGPKKRFKDHLKKSVKSFGIDPNRLEATAADRVSWRATCHDGAGCLRGRSARETRGEATAAPSAGAASCCPCAWSTVPDLWASVWLPHWSLQPPAYPSTLT